MNQTNTARAEQTRMSVVVGLSGSGSGASP
jgi:hypothetical protein